MENTNASFSNLFFASLSKSTNLYELNLKGIQEGLGLENRIFTALKDRSISGNHILRIKTANITLNDEIFK